MDKDRQFELRKRYKELSMARTTVESFIESVMPQIGLPYQLRYYNNGIELRIKLKNRRCIQVKLNRINYIKSIQKFLPVIESLVQAFDFMGPMNVQVRCYGYSEKWTEPEAVEPENEFNQPQE